eukprot:TRINITY_DN67570_c8_g1_i2.p1 TRINITY_DN67570_c8_g1~~TRINITY_DN67570_c8_g1_i2.p1  ORF type:complete len:356 (-),score=21.62 TRINITY_DN67570_c8_g1_i2:3146-4213(-)
METQEGTQDGASTNGQTSPQDVTADGAPTPNEQSKPDQDKGKAEESPSTGAQPDPPNVQKQTETHAAANPEPTTPPTTSSTVTKKTLTGLTKVNIPSRSSLAVGGLGSPTGGRLSSACAFTLAAPTAGPRNWLCVTDLVWAIDYSTRKWWPAVIVLITVDNVEVILMLETERVKVSVDEVVPFTPDGSTLPITLAAARKGTKGIKKDYSKRFDDALKMATKSYEHRVANGCVTAIHINCCYDCSQLRDYSPGLLIRCDWCDYTGHLDCQRPHVDASTIQPNTPWLCTSCKTLGDPQVPHTQCTAKGVTDETVIAPPFRRIVEETKDRERSSPSPSPGPQARSGGPTQPVAPQRLL